MKPLRTTAVLLALLVMPLFGSETLADFTADTVNIGPYETKVNAYTDNQPVIGFTIPADSETLKTVKVRSFIERAYATERVKLWVEAGDAHGPAGFHELDDQLLKVYVTSGIEFDINEIITLSNINYVISGVDTFYLTLDIYTDNVNAWPEYFHQMGLEVVLDSGFIILNAGAGGVNLNHVRNKGWQEGPPYFDPFRLIFDTQGPQFDLHFCVEESTCSLSFVDQEDSVRICATNVSPDIQGNIYITDAKKIFGVYPISLKFNVCDPAWMVCGCDSCFNTAFRIPDAPNTGGYDGIDADTGQWMICAWAEDSVGNRDTMCIGHDNLPWRIDTRKPLIDSVQFYLSYDANSDGIIALGDSVYVIGWGLSNPFFEVVKMEADMSLFGLEWIELDDALNNNRIFRKKVCLDAPAPIDTADIDLNTILVRAWDNACNYDTLRKGIATWVDLDPPAVAGVYEYHRDLDTTLACIGEGDSVRIGAWVAGLDIVSVEFNIKDAGIDSAGYLYYPLFDDGTHGDPTPNDGEYNLLWEVTAPPIEDGKDADNCIPPDVDTDYSVLIWVYDDAGNFDTDRGVLNRTLDTRLPRPIGFNCPDTVPCALHAQSLSGGRIQLFWDRDCDECDGWFFYVYVDSGFGYETTPIGATYDGEAGPEFNMWFSELLTEGYYRFKIRTEDNCGNLGPYSCEVGALADSTPPTACIIFPDSGEAYGDSFLVKARSEDEDIEEVCLWYRLRPDIEDPGSDPGPWQTCQTTPCMSRPGGGYVFFDTVACVHDYIGWVQLLPLSCDVIGNCQDTIRGYDEDCLEDDLGNLRPGHFLFYWDTTRAVIQVVSVNDTISPQSPCGFNVWRDMVNKVVLDVAGSDYDLFTIDVRGMVDDIDHRILYENNVMMPCTVDVSVDDWPQGTQNLFVYAIEEATGDTAIPAPLIIDLCVMTLSAPDTLWIVAYSPVDLIVTDPVGDSIGLEFNTIQDATYDDTVDWNDDGDLDDLVTIPHPYVGDYQIRVIREDGVPDTATYDLGIRIDGSDMDLLADGDTVPPADGSSNYSYETLPHLRGDANGDDVTNSADIVFLINYLFKSGPTPDPLELGDVNCDGVVNSADVVYMINYLFKGGPAPCS
jgi:hypothetical protein